MIMVHLILLKLIHSSESKVPLGQIAGNLFDFILFLFLKEM